MHTMQNIEQYLKAILTERTTVVDDPVYLWDCVSFPSSGIGRTASATIDTRFVKKLSIVCDNLHSTHLYIDIGGANTADGTIPVILNTIELDAVNLSNGYITTELYPFTIIRVINLDNENTGIVTVTYVITR